MRCGEINNSTYHSLHININFFAVQQSIDHIQKSYLWSYNQCSISILYFFLIINIKLILKKKHIQKKK